MTTTPNVPNSQPHAGFSVEEATTTEAGRIRGVILDTIAMRVGQVPDLHPRLLEGIEVAARTLAVATDVVAHEAAIDGTIPAAVIDAAAGGRAPDVVEVEPGTTAVQADYHDDQTIARVYAALSGIGFDTLGASEVVGALQNAGILFRERGPLAVREQVPGTINPTEPHRA